MQNLGTNLGTWIFGRKRKRLQLPSYLRWRRGRDSPATAQKARIAELLHASDKGSLYQFLDRIIQSLDPASKVYFVPIGALRPPARHFSAPATLSDRERKLKAPL